MTNTHNHLLINELKDHKLCQCFWSEELEQELSKKIALSYKPMGELGVYNKHYEFRLPYNGLKEELYETHAVLHLDITSGTPAYDVQKAIGGLDCFHNVHILVFKNDSTIITNKFQLWNRAKNEYCGNEEMLNLFLNH